jgi:hypothetical protein
MNYETMSNETKKFDWSNLPPGEYKLEGGEIIAINCKQESSGLLAARSNCAADNFLEALRRVNP